MWNIFDILDILTRVNMCIFLHIFCTYFLHIPPNVQDMETALLKSCYSTCVKCSKSSLRWYRENRHNEALTIFFWRNHFISKISRLLLVCPGRTQSPFHVFLKCSCSHVFTQDSNRKYILCLLCRNVMWGLYKATFIT